MGQAGILFVCAGRKHAEQAAISARSIRNTGTRLPIAIAAAESSPVASVFDQVVRTAEPGDFFEARILALRRSPFEETLFLDSDTYVARPPAELFALLDRFDLAAAHAPNRTIIDVDDVPDSYPEFNCGVILYRRTALEPAFFDDWLATYRTLKPRDPASFDQPSFRAACYGSNLRIATLPPEWNLRFTMGGYANQPVGIFHGWATEAEYRRLAGRLNGDGHGRDHYWVFGGGAYFEKEAGGPLRRVGRFDAFRSRVAIRTRLRATSRRLRGFGRGVYVVGMHRSGTSAVARTVNLLGVPLGDPADVIEPDAGSNPTGHWESGVLARFNDRLLEDFGGSWASPPRFAPGWEHEPRARATSGEARATFGSVYGRRTWAWKDPRLCLTLPYWRSVLGARAVAILVVRHPLEVARSLASRNGFPSARSLALWEVYNRRALSGLRGMPVLVTTYDSLLEDSRRWSQDAATFLSSQGFALERRPEALEDFVDPALRHVVHDLDSLDRDPVSPTQRQLYATLLGLAGAHASL